MPCQRGQPGAHQIRPVAVVLQTPELFLFLFGLIADGAEHLGGHLLATALQIGFERSVGRYVLTIPDRPQIDPEVTEDVAEAQEEVGVAPGGCAEQAEEDVGQSLAPVLATATADFALWICQDADGSLWYHGASRTDATTFITLPAAAVAGGYEAVNTGGTTYRIVDGRLTVRTPSGDLDTDQPLLDN